jgi:signal transduction histidine kinase
MNNQKVDSAIYVLNDVVSRLKKNADAWSLAMAYKALGKAHLLKANHLKASHFFRLSRDEFESLNNQNEVLLAVLNLAEVNSATGNVNRGLVVDYMLRFESLLPSVPKNRDVFLEVYQTAAEVYESIEEFNKALAYYRNYFSLRDTILDYEKDLKIQEIQIKYDTEKKEQEIVKLKQDEEIMALMLSAQDAKIERRNYLVIIVFMLMAFASVILTFYIKKQRERAKFDKEMAVKLTEERERLRMAKDLHDDLGSGLSKISFLSKRIPSVNTETESEYVNTIAETAENLIVNMRELIWVLTPENITIFGLISRIREFTSDFLEDFPIDFDLNVENQNADFSIHSEAHRQILMIVKEVLNNCVKHARATKLEINLQVDTDNFNITFEDNGVGINEKSRQGNGLINMESRTVKLGGQFDVYSQVGKGTKSAFSFPLASLRNIEVTK